MLGVVSLLLPDLCSPLSASVEPGEARGLQGRLEGQPACIGSLGVLSLRNQAGLSSLEAIEM